MRVIILVLVTLCLAACAAPKAETLPPSPGKQNQPHLPPPDFESIETSGERIACGGMIKGNAQQCQADEFCRRTIGDICGAADAPGYCSPMPEMCTQDYTPVCGCDGKTYSNECTANAQGVSANYAGDCK